MPQVSSGIELWVQGSGSVGEVTSWWCKRCYHKNDPNAVYGKMTTKSSVVWRGGCLFRETIVNEV